MRERKLRSTTESLLRLKGSLIPYTYNIYKIRREVKSKNTMRICSLSVPRLKDEWNQTVSSVNKLRCGTAGSRPACSGRRIIGHFRWRLFARLVAEDLCRDFEAA